jgi:hypothetical protein
VVSFANHSSKLRKNRETTNLVETVETGHRLDRGRPHPDGLLAMPEDSEMAFSARTIRRHAD